MQKILLVLFAVISLSACTEIIEIDLKEETQYVIEAPMYEGTHDFEVVISQTGDYFDGTEATKINDASVTLTDGDGSLITLTPNGNGTYMLPNFTSTVGVTYKLNVAVGGQTFNAQTTMQTPVTLDSISFQSSAGGPPAGGPGGPDTNEVSFIPFINFLDPAESANYYRVKMSVNGVPRSGASDIIVQEDALFNGNEVKLPYFVAVVVPFDTVTIELLSIDQQVYNYFRTLSSVISSGGNPLGSAAPANPITNFSGGALGYFGAFSSTRITKVVLP